MNKTLLKLGLMIVAAGISSAALISGNQNNQTYKPRKSAKIHVYTLSEEAYHHRMRMISNENGVFDFNRYMQLQQEVDMMIKENAGRAASLTWVEEGPDNVGGRTRAIAIDNNNPNIIYAASVSGGLFKSVNGGNTWQVLDGFNQNLSVSSICITGSGRIYVGTGFVNATHSTIYTQGNFRESFVGDGIFYSDDQGNTWQELVVTQLNSNPPINKIEADPVNPNKIWIAGAGPNVKLSTYEPANGWTTLSFTNSSVCDVKISKDGQVIVCGTGPGGGVTTFVSTDGGQNFVNMSGTQPGKLPSTGHYRAVYSISHEKNSNNSWNLYASFARTNNISHSGTYYSNDNGQTWYVIAPGGSAAFNPTGSQGDYDIIGGVQPGNPDRYFFAGLDIYRWNRNVGINPPFGQWHQLTQWFLPEFLPSYVHADQHEFRWDKNKVMYIGSDGGISKSFDGNNFITSNRGFNVTQFYCIGTNAWGDLIGGTQDNGTQINTHSGLTPLSFNEGNGGDGFDCDMSNISRNIMFGSLYFGVPLRSSNGGQSFSPLFDSLSNYNSSFYTRLKYWETLNDPNSQDSVMFINSIKQQQIALGNGVTKKFTGNINQFLGTNRVLAPGTIEILFGANPVITDNGSGQLVGSVLNMDSVNTINYTTGAYQFSVNVAPSNNLPIKANHFIRYNPGSTINYTSQSHGVNLTHNVTTIINPDDTIKLVDPVQSWFVFGITASPAAVGLWMTREAPRTNAQAKWFRIPNATHTGNLPGNANAFVFSNDGNYLFIAYDNRVVRVAGLNTVYAPAYNTSGLVIDDIFVGSNIEGIAIDPNNSDRLIITTIGTGSGTKIFRTTQATTAPNTTGQGTFVGMQGNLPQMPVYDAIINVYDHNVVVVGTEFGVWATDNAWAASPNWTYQGVNNSPGRVPVTCVRQQQWTQPWVQNKGAIYIGTYGRGIFRSDTYLNANNNKPEALTTAVNNLLVYPNPMSDMGIISLDLSENSNVQVRILDLKGRLVKNMNLGQLSQGKQLVNINVSELSTGTYIVNVLIGSESKSTRLVVTR